MTPHAVFPVEEASQVGEARRHAALLAGDVGLDAVAAGRLALVVTEMGNNLARHASAGRLLLHARPDEQAVEVLSTDDGPGMADVARCMQDGYSSAGTPGTGLGAVRRMASSFEIFSSAVAAAQGTVIRALVRPAHHADLQSSRHADRLASHQAAPLVFDVGAVCTAAPGEVVSGDGWALRQEGDRAALLVVDGLGHGPNAKLAADAALQAFHAHPFAVPSTVLQHAHDALRSLRGAAAAVALLDDGARRITFCGVGNIAGRILSGVHDRSLLSQHGTAGLQMRRLQDLPYDWPDHALLVLHSDGIATRWNLAEVPGLLQAGPSLIAAWLLGKHSRGRDDATVVVVRLH